MLGFLNLNKPAGVTSHDCVAQVRRLMNLRRVGHGGTLDPLATGVLPIAVGPATRLLSFVPTEKAYRATIRLGLITTTDDVTGEVIATSPVPDDLGQEDIEHALAQFQGTIQQIPPAYSAIQVQGKRLYTLARQGKPVSVPPRSVTITEIRVLDWRRSNTEFPEVDLDITCGPGTYIRSLARNLGEVLKTGGTLAQLQRTRSSGFGVADSLSLETLASQIQQGTFQPISPAIALQHLPIISLTSELSQRFTWGQRLILDNFQDCAAAEVVQVQSLAGDFLGVASLEGARLQPKVVLSAN